MGARARVVWCTHIHFLQHGIPKTRAFLTSHLHAWAVQNIGRSQAGEREIIGSALLTSHPSMALRAAEVPEDLRGGVGVGVRVRIMRGAEVLEVPEYL